jgi:hypothetical protein
MRARPTPTRKPVNLLIKLLLLPAVNASELRPLFLYEILAWDF